VARYLRPSGRQARSPRARRIHEAVTPYGDESFSPSHERMITGLAFSRGVLRLARLSRIAVPRYARRSLLMTASLVEATFVITVAFMAMFVFATPGRGLWLETSDRDVPRN